MGRSRPAGGGERRLTALLFTDLVGSTELATSLGDERWRRLLERHHKAVRRELKRFRGRELDTAGDGFFASFDSPAAAIRCASAAMNAVADLGLQLRAGVHMGEAVEVDRKVGGFAVHVAARIAALAGAGEVLVSSTVRDLVGGSGIGFESAGEHALKGVDEPWKLYRVHRHADLAPREVAALPPAADDAATRSLRRWLVPVAVLAALAAGATIWAITRPGAPEAAPSGTPSLPPAVYTDGLFRIDPATNEVVAQTSEIIVPIPIVRDGDFLWTNHHRFQVAKFNADANEVVGTVRLEPSNSGIPPDIAIGEGSVWVVHHISAPGESEQIYEIDPSTNRVVGQISFDRETHGLVVVGGTFWVAAADGAVLRIDPRTGRTEQAIPVGGTLVSLVGGEGYLWALDVDGKVARVNPRNADHQSVRVSGPQAVAVGAGSLWVTTDSGSLVRFDPGTLDRTGSVEVGERAFALSVGAGSVWVGTRGDLPRDGELIRVNPETVTVQHVLSLGGRPASITITAEDDAIWLGTWTRYVA